MLVGGWIGIVGMAVDEGTVACPAMSAGVSPAERQATPISASEDRTRWANRD